MTTEQEQQEGDEREGEPAVRFTYSLKWVTDEQELIKRLQRLEEGYVNLSRWARAQMSDLELFIEGVEELQRLKPTYEILRRVEKKAANETNDRV